jgi:SAM-dependent methyltransferase
MGEARSSRLWWRSRLSAGKRVVPLFLTGLLSVTASAQLAGFHKKEEAKEGAGKVPKFANKLAPYVASPARVVDRMLELAHFKAGEILYDLGCGDGRILVAAASKYKVKAVGVEISPKLVIEASDNIQKAGLTDQARVMQGDLLTTDFSSADVVTIYLATSLNEKLRPRLEKLLKPGARVISSDYPVPGWKPTQVAHAEGAGLSAKEGATRDDRHKHMVFVYEMPPSKDVSAN